MGRFEEALDYYDESIKLSKEAGLSERLSREERNIGEVYMFMGNWKESIAHFKVAYDLALNQKTIDWNQIAGILYDLGYVYSLAGEYDVGIDYSDQAIELLEKLKLPHRVASAKLIRGDIHRRVGHYDTALNDIKQAIPAFDEVDYQHQAAGYFYLGFVLWYKGEETSDTNLLKESQRSFEMCVDMSRKYGLVKELPRALHEVSQLHWVLGLKEKARDANDEAHDIAVQAHDIYYAVNSLVKKAEFDYDDGKYETILEYAKKLKQEFRDKGYKFPLFYGRMDRIVGAIAFDKKNYNDAINSYAKGLYLIAQHGGYGRYTVKQELNNLQEKLQTLSDEEALMFYNGLKTYWSKQGVDIRKPKMISWVDQHISRLTFQMRS
ncbi:MAG: tetratricopeptide repeat protein [Desulfobacterales bacterium]|nr:tetratricopeptide repeat protein [Desulfobacterales bacterium]